MSVTTAINAELIEWFATLPAWQNEAFRRLLARPVLSAADYDQILSCARAELGLDVMNPLPARLTEAELPTAPATTGPAPQLAALHTLTEVNMIDVGQRLNIGAGLTLVCGINGAGKSGYARVCKLACRCHEAAAEGILPNIYQATSLGPKASAIFELTVAGTPQTVNWQTDITVPILRSFAVFDAKAARSYLTERNVVAVMPLVLTKLELLGAVIKTVKDRLQAEATTTQPRPEALQHLVDGTSTGQLLAKLTAATPAKTLEDTLVWVEADQAKLTDLSQQEAKLKAEGPQALRRLLQLRRGRLATLQSVLASAEQVVSAAQVDVIRQQQQLCGRLQEQKAATAEQALTGAVVPGTGSPAWETLMRAAAAFFASEAKPGEAFPGSLGAAQCMLCQQGLSAEAHDRLDRFWKFLQNDLSMQLVAADEQLARLAKGLVAVPAELPPNLTALADNLAEDVPVIWSQVSDYLATLADRRNAMVAAGGGGDWAAVPALPPALSVACATEDAALQVRETALADATQAQAELTKLTTQVNELAARQRATAARALILDHHQRLARTAQLRTAADQVSTQTVSIKGTHLQKKHVTKAFELAVQQQASELGLKRAVPGISSQTEYGKTTQSVLIGGAKLANIAPHLVFSEGEQTALALAYFLAEHTDPAATPALIFDDPVTSLGHRIRARVIEKLVALAAGRQIVVFTHDLSFYCGLKDAATRAGVPLHLRSMEAFSNRAGIIRDGEPVDAMNVADREKWLGELLTLAKTKEAAGDGPGLADVTARFYGVLRATWERAVEELLFNKVVMRFDEAIKTQSLTGAVVDATIIATIFAAMTKCSGHIDAHDHAAGANVPMPDIAEMTQDLDALRTFRAEQKKKVKTQEAQLIHLKA